MRVLILVLFLLSFTAGVAQEFCGTTATEEQLQFMNLIHEGGISGRTKSSLVRIPLVFHVIRTSSGEGGFSQSQANGLISRINGYYSPASMEFFLAREVNYINSDTYYNLDSSNEGGVAVPNDVTGVINVYFSNSLTSGGLQLCGYTRFPPSSDRVFMAIGCTFNGTTLEHELGHYFTLFHTHGKTNTGTTDELVNGSNCSIAGDDICDTPADPNLSGKVGAGCVYTGTNLDANGQPYAPQVSNIMSYAPSSCRIQFTAGQYQRIRNGFENGRSYLQVEFSEFTAGIFAPVRSTCKGGTIDFLATGSGAVAWEWEFPGGTPSTSSNKNPRIRYDIPGSYRVKLTARAANNQTFVVERLAFISITDPLESAITGTQHYPINDGIPFGFTLRNPDQGTTFMMSSIDRDNNPNSGSLTVNNFNYITEQPINYDYLISPFYNNAGVRNYQVSFDVSYAPRLGGDFGEFIRTDTYDSLSLIFYGRCGVAPVQLWKQGGADLQTSTAKDFEFLPDTGEWKRIELNVNITNEEFAQFTFVNSSLNGNNVYIDNISVAPDYSLNAPTNFRVTRTNPGDVLLRWFDQSTNELNFVIERSVNGGPFEEYALLPPNTLSYLDVNTEAGNLYMYRLYASGFSENISAKVGPIAVDLVVGIEKTLALSLVKIFPNPFSNKITIELPEGVMNVKFELFDVSGRFVGVIFDALSDNLYSADTSFLKNGFYILKVKNETSQTIFRVIK